MRNELAGVAAAFIGLNILAGFNQDAIILFGTGCALVAIAVIIKKPIFGVLGIFELSLLSPLALEYTSMSLESTMVAALVLLTLPTAMLFRLSLAADEKRRFDWKIDKKAALVAVLVTVLVFHAIFAFSLLGDLGQFLGDVENTGVQVLVLTFATAVVASLVLVPPKEEPAAKRS